MSEKLSDNPQEGIDAVFYSRPIVLPGTSFGSINLFFNPTELEVCQVEKLGTYLAECVEQFFTDSQCSSCACSSISHSKKDRTIN